MAVGARRRVTGADAEGHAAQPHQQHLIARLERQVAQVQRWGQAPLQPIIGQRCGRRPLAAQLNGSELAEYCHQITLIGLPLITNETLIWVLSPTLEAMPSELISTGPEMVLPVPR